MTFIAAGHETTSNALTWALYLVSQDDGVRDAARGGGRPRAAGRALEAGGLERLVYTRAVIDEALRLYPPAATLTRDAVGPDRSGRAARSRPAGGSSSRPGCCIATTVCGTTRTGSIRRASCPENQGSDRPVRLSAVRRGPAGVHRGVVRAAGGRHDPGDGGPAFPAGPCARSRRDAGPARLAAPSGRHADDPPAPCVRRQPWAIGAQEHLDGPLDVRLELVLVGRSSTARMARSR